MRSVGKDSVKSLIWYWRGMGYPSDSWWVRKSDYPFNYDVKCSCLVHVDACMGTYIYKV